MAVGTGTLVGYLLWRAPCAYPADMELREKNVIPQPKLIGLLTTDMPGDSEQALEQQDEATAIRTAQEMARRHGGAFTWSRAVDLINVLFGTPEVLCLHGAAPHLE